MRALIEELLNRDRQADRVVPPSGFTAQLTTLTAAAMTFLAVFALALSLASGRLADRWAGSLAGTATVRISAPVEQLDLQTNVVMKILETTPGIASAKTLSLEDQSKLLEPWFGPDLPIDALPLPRLIEITEGSPAYDAGGLRLRLQAEAPGAVLDDHERWRRPMAVAASRLRLLGGLSMVLLGVATGGMITLAATAAMSANLQVIKVLRLVGAQDSYIVQAFVRRFTLRALIGAVAGTFVAIIAVSLLPAVDEAGGFLTGLGFSGWGWVLPWLLPPLVAGVAFAATRFAALRILRELH